MLGALIAGGASLAGSIISAKGQKRANEQNVALSREQMDFQERMSNTAYQRATQDLEKSGLNRILALGNSASTPPGARPNVLNEAPDLAPAVNTAMAARRLAAEIKNIQETNKAIRAGVDKTKQETDESETREALTSKQILMLQANLKEAEANAALYKKFPWMKAVEKVVPMLPGSSALGLMRGIQQGYR